MGALYDALVGLSPVRDEELLDSYERYESLLATILTAEQMEAYAATIQRERAIRIFEELTPAELAGLTAQEQAIATAVMAHERASMENRRVVALLTQRGQQAVAPDLDLSGDNS